MNPDLRNEILQRLEEYQFKHQQGWLRQGKCPNCGKKELYTHAEEPWVIRCGRLNKCGYEASIKELYPDLFDNWSNRYQPTPSNNYNHHAAADAYLSQARGFNLDFIHGTYTQENYVDRRLNIHSATVRFKFGDTWWERLIDQPARFGNRKAGFAPGAKYKGEHWVLPRIDLTKVKEVWLVEGIFDVIALAHHNIDAVAIMSCTNYPSKFLDYLSKVQHGKSCLLVWALDNDNAGNSYTLRHVKRASEEGWLNTAALIPNQGKYRRDWNDLHLLSKQQGDDDNHPFSDNALKNYRYYGNLLLAKSATEKAKIMMNHNQHLKTFDFSYDNRWYWCDMDFDKYRQALDQISSNNPGLSFDEVQEQAMQESKSIRQIANCMPEPLYYQANEITDESWYFWAIRFPHGNTVIKNTFTAAQLSTATEFKKRLLSIAPGGVFTGTNQMLERVIEKKLYNIKSVQTIDYIGYSAKHKTYVYNNVAVRDGKVVELNAEDYFDFNSLSIKSLLRIDQFSINTTMADYKQDWAKLLWQAYGVKGYTVLIFFFATLFAEQIRATQDSFPFLEVVGEAATGKTTLIEFCWKLFGRVGHEGTDPEKASPAARARSLAQVSNLPVVLLESDRVSVDNKTPHTRKFSWDELKTAYNGRSVRSRGVATGGNETYDPPFRGSIIISQNDTVQASEPILQRICHVYFDGQGYNENTRKAALALARLDVNEVSGFILNALTKESKILEKVAGLKDKYTDSLMNHPKIHTGRIAHNHAQLMSFAEALRLIIDIPDDVFKQILEYLESMAIARQTLLNEDHPLVQEFWEVYEYLNGEDALMPRLNHSKNPNEIAINLNEYLETAINHKQAVPSLRDLKNILKSSRKFKYVGQRCIHSAIKARHPHIYKSASTRCWIFTTNQ